MTDLDNRVALLEQSNARLEQKNEQYDLEICQLRRQLRQLDRERLQPMQHTLNEVGNRITGHRNFLAGMLFVITGFWGGAIYLLREAWIFLSNGGPT